mmetsp:Transcript_38530/g.111300  ORF Transcript_38530/g.111300 Transcript_38530/m.111300 type:complete len:434 (-) Transcript_38530:307-1608(-)
MQSTRRAWLMSCFMVCSMTCMAAGSDCTLQNLSTRSGAPLSTAKTPCERWPWTVSIHLFSELKGISKIFSLAGLLFVARTDFWPPCTSVQARMMATSVGEPVHLSSPSSTLQSAPLFKMPQRAMPERRSAAEGGKRSLPSSRTTTSSPSVAMPAGPCARGTQRSWTHISPLVRVPVLSEQKTETQPRVSTASIFLTSTFLFTIWSEAIMSEIVTVGSSPSGTCAKSAAALFCRIAAGGLRTGERMLAARLSRPTPMATIAMMWTKCSIWTSSVETTREDLMPCAILPRKVPSPMACTMQVAFPFSTVVPKKARFRASVGGVAAGSVRAFLGSGMDSPVRAELSTSMPSEQARMRTSAGMRLPASRKITSPGTKCTGSRSTSILSPFWPILTAGTAEAACSFCIASICDSAFSSEYHCSSAAMTITAERIMGVT